MINDGLIERIDYKTNQPHVKYKLTELGNEMLPIINSMESFGIFYKSTFTA